VLRLDRIGDLVMSLPALAELRAALPQARIRLAVGAWSEDIAKSAPVDEILVWSAPWVGRPSEGAMSFAKLAGAARALRKLPLDLAIDLDVPTEIVLKRIAGRRVCAECGAVYHVEQPPANDWTCDVCGEKVVQRDDDTEEAVMRRLELYEIETLPVIQFFRRTSALAHVDGSGESDEVFKKLVETVESRVDRSKP